MQSILARSSYIASLMALVAALTVCMTIVVFSWPDQRGPKRTVSPVLAECCDVKIASTTLLTRRSRAPDTMPGEASIVPASLP